MLLHRCSQNKRKYFKKRNIERKTMTCFQIKEVKNSGVGNITATD